MTESSDSTLREVVQWAFGQARYLTPTQHHVLLYLTVNAFLTDTNPEHAPRGQVYRGRSNLAQIRLGTGLSESSVQRGLNALLAGAFIYVDLQPGHGANTVRVCWGVEMNDLREEIRAGVKPLPKMFERTKKTPSIRLASSDGVVINLPM